MNNDINKKKIAVFSQDGFELTTELVMDWITHFGCEVERINGADLLNKHSFNIALDNEFGLMLKDSKIKDERAVIWYRRWMDKEYLDHYCLSNDLNLFEADISKFVKSEFDGLTNSYFDTLKDHKWDNIPNFIKKFPIKLTQLNVARKVGILIPKTIITNNKHDLQSFIDKHNVAEVITKPIKDAMVVGSENTYYSMFTKIIDVKSMPDIFFPSLFQESIKKEFEVRVFFYDKVSYSMAIFSSLDQKTKNDFRNYNFQKPNRFVPFTLPEVLNNRIIIMMEQLGLETGSLDFIVTKSNDFVFLEVNPLGQFGMISQPCNYFLEKIIAKNLIRKNDYEQGST